MNRELFQEIHSFLKPYLGTVGERESLLDNALFNCGVVSQINFAGDAHQFTTHLIKKLDKWGKCADSEDPALIELLRYVGEELGGTDVNAEAEALIQRLMADTEPTETPKPIPPTPQLKPQTEDQTPIPISTPTESQTPSPTPTLSQKTSSLLPTMIFVALLVVGGIALFVFLGGDGTPDATPTPTQLTPSVVAVVATNTDEPSVTQPTIQASATDDTPKTATNPPTPTTVIDVVAADSPTPIPELPTATDIPPTTTPFAVVNNTAAGCGDLPLNMTCISPIGGTSFAIGSTEVTRADFFPFANNPLYVSSSDARARLLRAAGAQDNQPMIRVSWEEARAYCQSLGEGYDIPTFEQWTIAAYHTSNGTRTTYPWGNNEIPSVGNFSGAIQDVALTAPNDWGIYDMAGNVAEWVREDDGQQDIYRTLGGDARANESNLLFDNNMGRLYNTPLPQDDLESVGFRCILIR